VPSTGSGDVLALAEAQGLLRQPAHGPALEAGARVDVLPFPRAALP
jgi:molybdopterin biosynthesis enzyme